ncbi:MAG: 30S ribosomal protein S17 [Candidatus Woesebacteria bacterium GW2011_GWB1_45_5]|uniref:Small ribosomal subunit protein uS17 n=1 Tax=Candidatus Woesebacteria bacterium GW2011_GWB1_45_5 TaxID=1618581 RepID=A0A0G1MMJ5_9BACT|nr:MAG: 30S ribosomal protein S17 [Candidatus Woesebacteria bacterium GW2011_GWB1_45_5]
MKIFTGKVIGTKTAKTATVAVERVVIHPLYKKRFKRDRKYQVHDETGVAVGDTVKFVATRPYSKMKKWKITEVVKEKGKVRK